MRKALLALAALGLMLVPDERPARAADSFAIDKAHSNIVFLINHLGYSRMIGQFQEFEGLVTFDEANVGIGARWPG